MTGFHYLSYAYAVLLLNLIYFLKEKRRVKMLKHVKVYRRHPYDLIPMGFLRKHLFLIYMFEVLSMCVKLLIMRLKISLQRPKIVLIDEGAVNVAFNYIAFFFMRNSMLWKPMLRYFLTFSRPICRNCFIMLLTPNMNAELNMWSRRGDFPSSYIAKVHIKAYRRALRPLLKLIYRYTGAKVYAFSNNIEALRFIIKHLHLGCDL